MNVAIPLRDLDQQWQKLTDKFTTLATPHLGASGAARLADTCRNLEALGSATELAAQVRAAV